MGRCCCRYEEDEGVKLRRACAADSSVLSSEGPSLKNWQVMRIGEDADDDDDEEEKEDASGGVARAGRDDDDDEGCRYACSGLPLAEGRRRGSWLSMAIILTASVGRS